MMTLGEIASGNADTADVMFLLGAIAFGLAMLIALVRIFTRPRVHDPADPGHRPITLAPWEGVLVQLGLGLVAVGCLVL